MIHPAVRLQEIVDALAMQSEESSSFFDRNTGRIETVSADLLRAAEQPSDPVPELLAWQRPEWEFAQRIVAADYFEPLSTQFEVHEWAIMRDFAHSLPSKQVRKSCSMLYTELEPSGISKAPYGGRDSSPPGLLSAQRRSSRRPQLVRRAANRLAIERRNGGYVGRRASRLRQHSSGMCRSWEEISSIW